MSHGKIWPLFGKPRRHLLYSFIHGRFGEPTIFGNEDMYKWLAAQRNAPRPDSEQWDKYILDRRLVACRHFDARRIIAGLTNVEMIKQACQAITPQALLKVLPKTVQDSGVGDLLKSFSPKITLYRTTMTAIIMLRGDRLSVIEWQETKQQRVGEITNVTVERFCAIHALSALYACWKYATNKDNVRRARKKLCNLITHWIQEEREKAMKDFGNAAAVSKNGRKVVCANSILVLRQDNSSYSLGVPGANERKHLLSMCVRVKVEELGKDTPERNERLVALFEQHGAPQLLLECLNGRKIFVIRPQYCS